MSGILKNSILAFLTVSAMSVLAEAKYSPNPICQIIPLQDSRVQGRASLVQFPDGRQLTVVGHHHGQRQIYRIFNLARAGRLQSMNDADFMSLLSELRMENNVSLPLSNSQAGRAVILQQARTQNKVDLSPLMKVQDGHRIGASSVLDHAQADYAFLKDVVLGQTSLLKIQFVGNEAQDQQRDLMAQQIRFAYQSLQNEVERRHAVVGAQLSPQQTEEIYVSIINGHNYLYLTDPELLKSIPNVGVESEGSVRLYNENNALGKIAGLWNHMLKKNQEYWDSLPVQDQVDRGDQVLVQFFLYQKTLHEDVQSMIIGDLTELKKRVSRVRPWVPSWLSSTVEELFRLYALRIQINQQRDLDAVKNMVARKENGVHFVGQNHLNQRLNYLVQLCEQERKALKP